jgi:hypothetical protein
MAAAGSSDPMWWTGQQTHSSNHKLHNAHLRMLVMGNRAAELPETGNI